MNVAYPHPRDPVIPLDRSTWDDRARRGRHRLRPRRVSAGPHPVGPVRDDRRAAAHPGLVPHRPLHRARVVARAADAARRAAGEVVRPRAGSVRPRRDDLAAGGLAHLADPGLRPDPVRGARPAAARAHQPGDDGVLRRDLGADPGFRRLRGSRSVCQDHRRHGCDHGPGRGRPRRDLPLFAVRLIPAPRAAGRDAPGIGRGAAFGRRPARNVRASWASSSGSPPCSATGRRGPPRSWTPTSPTRSWGTSARATTTSRGSAPWARSWMPRASC